eukprot:7376430-Prymnesium_polylepis.1
MPVSHTGGGAPMARYRDGQRRADQPLEPPRTLRWSWLHGLLRTLRRRPPPGAKFARPWARTVHGDKDW